MCWKWQPNEAYELHVFRGRVLEFDWGECVT